MLPRPSTRLTTAGGLILLAASAAIARPPGYAWHYQGQDDDVALWTSEVGRTSLGAVKVSASFALGVRPLLAVLRDIRHFPRWYRDCAQVRLLRSSKREPIRLDARGKFVPRALDESYRLFFLQHVDVIADRWAVIENTARVRPNGSLEIAFSSCDRCAYPAPDGTVRMALSGVWVLTPIDERHTEVSYTIDLDLDTSLPNILLRPRVIDAARGTLLALGAQAARSDRAENAAATAP